MNFLELIISFIQRFWYREYMQHAEWILMRSFMLVLQLVVADTFICNAKVLQQKFFLLSLKGKVYSITQKIQRIRVFHANCVTSRNIDSPVYSKLNTFLFRAIWAYFLFSYLYTMRMFCGTYYGCICSVYIICKLLHPVAVYFHFWQLYMFHFTYYFHLTPVYFPFDSCIFSIWQLYIFHLTAVYFPFDTCIFSIWQLYIFHLTTVYVPFDSC